MVVLVLVDTLKVVEVVAVETVEVAKDGAVAVEVVEAQLGVTNLVKVDNMVSFILDLVVMLITVVSYLTVKEEHFGLQSGEEHLLEDMDITEVAAAVAVGHQDEETVNLEEVAVDQDMSEVCQMVMLLDIMEVI